MDGSAAWHVLLIDKVRHIFNATIYAASELKMSQKILNTQLYFKRKNLSAKCYLFYLISYRSGLFFKYLLIYKSLSSTSLCNIYFFFSES